jgi:hypothetical protein
LKKKRRHKKQTYRNTSTNEVLGRSLLLSLIAVMSAWAPTETKAQTTVPKIVVNVLIDQLRTDYLNAFMPLYGEEGFRRLLQEGRIYPQAEYPIAKPDRASASATIACGTPPSHHGIIGMKWLDRATLRPVFCVDDKQFPGTGGTTDYSSPIHLAVSTIGDELKVATEGKSLVYSISPFRDAAILTAGHAADGAVWIDSNTGKWSSTSYYGPLPGWAAVRNQFHALDEKLKNIHWEPSSDLVGNFSYFLSGGMRKPFRHKFKDSSRFSDFKTSGLVNEEIASTAVSCIENSMMGNDGITDYLTITLYAGNFCHRPTSEFPMELQDTYVRLDRSLAQLIHSVERKVGKDNALFVLTSTGYTDEESADLSKYRIPTGTFDMNRAMALLNMYLVAVYGQGQFVESCFGTQLYLNHKLIESKQINQVELLERSQDLLLQLSGVKDVYTSQRMLQGAWTPGISRIRGGYNPKFSGDILIEVSPGWRYVNSDTRENQLVRESYIPFPIIFWGNGIKTQTIEQPVTIDYIAPTLSKAMRIRAPNACSLPPLF